MRNTAVITIDAEGRDKGKTFFLREMSASQAEKWAMRAFYGLSSSGVEVPDYIMRAGVAGLSDMGLVVLMTMDFKHLEPLMDEMFACVQFMPDASKPSVVRPLVDEDIEEVATRMRLRKDIFGLHMDFSKAGALFNSASSPAQAADSPSQ